MSVCDRQQESELSAKFTREKIFKFDDGRDEMRWRRIKRKKNLIQFDSYKLLCNAICSALSLAMKITSLYIYTKRLRWIEYNNNENKREVKKTRRCARHEVEEEKEEEWKIVTGMACCWVARNRLYLFFSILLSTLDHYWNAAFQYVRGTWMAVTLHIGMHFIIHIL